MSNINRIRRKSPPSVPPSDRPMNHHILPGGLSRQIINQALSSPSRFASVGFEYRRGHRSRHVVARCLRREGARSAARRTGSLSSGSHSGSIQSAGPGRYGAPSLNHSPIRRTTCLAKARPMGHDTGPPINPGGCLPRKVRAFKSSCRPNSLTTHRSASTRCVCGYTCATCTEAGRSRCDTAPRKSSRRRLRSADEVPQERGRRSVPRSHFLQVGRRCRLSIW